MSGFCLSSRASIRSSVDGGGTFRMTARAYASVCSSPGTTRHSYVHRLTAVAVGGAPRRSCGKTVWALLRK
ncbi:hypothetical protein M2169_000478 [Streptomyces sp. MJP52]|nr:hypothetical protein [Streptomyces sp. MJP52]